MKIIFVGLAVLLCIVGSEAAKEKAIKVKDKDMMRKMIIYDKVKFKIFYCLVDSVTKESFRDYFQKTPNLFYCPVPNKQPKSWSIDKMIVKWVKHNSKLHSLLSNIWLILCHIHG